jgi:uncharacterized protein (DUF2147 family)
MKLLRAIILPTLLLLSTITFAQSTVSGYWKSIDDQTGEVTAYWKLEVMDNQMLGYLVNYPGMKPDNVCMECKGELQEFFEKPISNTAWLKLSKNRDGIWEDGYIIDSGKGEKYKAKVWVEDGKLMMRGYIGFFFRTQTWLRTDQAAVAQEKFID